MEGDESCNEATSHGPGLSGTPGLGIDREIIRVEWLTITPRTTTTKNTLAIPNNTGTARSINLSTRVFSAAGLAVEPANRSLGFMGSGRSQSKHWDVRTFAVWR